MTESSTGSALLCGLPIEDMEYESPLSAYVAHFIEYADDLDLIAWAVECLRTGEDFSADPYFIELASLNTKQPKSAGRAGVLLETFVKRHWPEFDLSDAKSERCAMRYFKSRLEVYLAGSCTPWQVCRMICPIEQAFDFPWWLGSMYDACDWIGPDAKPSDCRHLEGMVAETLERL